MEELEGGEATAEPGGGAVVGGGGGPRFESADLVLEGGD